MCALTIVQLWGEMSTHVLCLLSDQALVFLVQSCTHSVCILDVQLLQIHDLQIFSHPVDCLVPFLMVSFESLKS